MCTGSSSSSCSRQLPAATHPHLHHSLLLNRGTHTVRYTSSNLIIIRTILMVLLCLFSLKEASPSPEKAVKPKPPPPKRTDSLLSEVLSSKRDVTPERKNEIFADLYMRFSYTRKNIWSRIIVLISTEEGLMAKLTWPRMRKLWLIFLYFIIVGCYVVYKLLYYVFHKKKWKLKWIIIN